MISNNIVHNEFNKFIRRRSVIVEQTNCEIIDLIEDDSRNENAEESDEPCRKKSKSDAEKIHGTQTLISKHRRPKTPEKGAGQTIAVTNTKNKKDSAGTTKTAMELDDGIKPKEGPDGNTGMVRIRELQTTMTEETLTKFRDQFCDLTKAHSNPAGSSHAADQQPSTVAPLTLNRVKELYFKYFKKRSQENVVIVANVLNLICLSKKIHESRTCNLYKEAPVLSEQTKADIDEATRIHNQHKQILEDQLRSHVIEVLSEVDDEDFEYTFRMFLMSILITMRALDRPEFVKGKLFQNISLMLLNALLNCSQRVLQQNIFAVLLSNSLKRDCAKLASTIQRGHKKSSLLDRLRLFFITNVENKCFQLSIRTVMSDTGTNVLSVHIKRALQRFRRISTFVEPVEEEAPPVSSNMSTPDLPVVKKKPSDGVLQHTFVEDELGQTHKLVPIPYGPATPSQTTTLVARRKSLIKKNGVKKNSKTQVRRKRETNSNKQTDISNCNKKRSANITNNGYNQTVICANRSSDSKVAKFKTAMKKIVDKIQVRRKREKSPNKQTGTSERTVKPSVLNNKSGFNQQVTTNCGSDQSVTNANVISNNPIPIISVSQVFIPGLGTCYIKSSDIQMLRNQETNSNKQLMQTSNHIQKRPVLNINSGINQQVISTNCGNNQQVVSTNCGNNQQVVSTNCGINQQVISTNCGINQQVISTNCSANQSVAIVNGSFNNYKPPSLVTPVFGRALGTCCVNNSDIQVATPTTVIPQVGVKNSAVQVCIEEEANSNNQMEKFNNFNNKHPVENTICGFNESVTSDNCGYSQSVTSDNVSSNQTSITFNGGSNRSVTITLPKKRQPAKLKLCFENGSSVYQNHCL